MRLSPLGPSAHFGTVPLTPRQENYSASIRFGKRDHEEDVLKLSALQRYRHHVGDIPHLQPGEMTTYLQDYYDGDDTALGKLILPFQDFAIAMAYNTMRRYNVGHNEKVQHMDLVMAANEALIESLSKKKFKVQYAEKNFVSYVTTIFERSMLKYLRRSMSPFKRSPTHETAYLVFYGLQSNFLAERGRKPTLEEVQDLAEKHGIKEKVLRYLPSVYQDFGAREISLDAPVGDRDDDRIMAEYVADPSPSAELVAHQVSARTTIVSTVALAFRELTGLQQYVVARRFGLWPDKEPMTQKAVAEELIELTGTDRGRESVSSIERIAMDRITDAMQPLKTLLDDPPKTLGRGFCAMMLERITPKEADSFVAPQSVYLKLLEITQEYRLLKPFAEISPIQGSELTHLNPHIPDEQGYFIRYDMTTGLKPQAFNERLNEIQEFLERRNSVGIVYPGDLNAFGEHPDNHNRELRMVIFPPNGERPYPLIIMERGEGTGMMREMIKSKLHLMSERDQTIAIELFDLNGDGSDEQTTVAVSEMPEIELTQAAVSKVKRRIMASVEEDIKTRTRETPFSVVG